MLLTLFLVLFIDLLGFGIVIPILPYYAESFGATAWDLGWLMTIYSLMQFLFAPLWGQLSDRIGRRKVLLISIFGTVLSLTGLGFASSLVWLFIARFCAGIMTANISTAYAYVADVTTQENRSKGMGLIGAGFGLGFIFGPAIGGILSQHGYSTPLFFAAGLSALNLILAIFILKEPPLTHEQRKANRDRKFNRTTLKEVLSHPLTGSTTFLFFLLTLAVVQMEVSFALYLKTRFSKTALQAGYLLGTMGLIMAFIQGGLIGKLSKLFGDIRLVLIGTVLMSAGMSWFGQTFDYTHLIYAMILMAFGHGILHPTLSSLCSQGAAPSRRGVTMGIFHSSSSLARIVGPPMSGYLFDHLGAGTPFIAASGVLLLAFVLAKVVQKKWEPQMKENLS
ncbi:MAG: tetracycline resistance MFS efflux pump [Bdellovibrionaceae bacterium]|nr:tetracycline resistance MFS efflux pump [Pseudobdellovibrionaceae bacterium]|tara:strand:- start:2332 stop:3510 length:1179 start_codon:yes stop_codon:yes gene_type:complete